MLTLKVETDTIMADILSDADIQRLTVETKFLSESFQEQMRLKPKRGHKEAELSVSGADGSSFKLILRQSNFNPLDFSVILGYEIPKTNVLFRLCRYNGSSHWHTNKIEGDRFFGYHIHLATQRYQQSGLDPDGFAEPTQRYADLHDAVQCALTDCHIELPPNAQLALSLAGDES